jgi:hypothetical protein
MANFAQGAVLLPQRRSRAIAPAACLRASCLELLSERSPDANQIADATYNPAAEQLHNLSGRHDGRSEYAAMSEHQITDAEYAAALAAGRTEAESEIRAQAVRYVPDRDAVEIVTMRNTGFLIPRQWIDALQDVPAEDLAKLEVWPDGSAIELEDRDIHISVHGLMTATLPALPPRAVAAIFGRRGGRATSEAKRSSAQANGQKGGRPQKSGKSKAA